MSPPFPVFVIVVQQAGFQSWTVYRRFIHFRALTDQLQLTHDVPSLPLHSADSLELGFIEQVRRVLNKWMQSIIVDPTVLRTQSMYQFLCADANVSPPYLDVYWREPDVNDLDEAGIPLDEMDMDEMFDKAGGGEETTDDLEESTEDIEKHGRNYTSGVARSKMAKNTAADDMDDINIQSISLVEQAEFLYDQMEDESTAAETAGEAAATPSAMAMSVQGHSALPAATTVSTAHGLVPMERGTLKVEINPNGTVFASTVNRNVAPGASDNRSPSHLPTAEVVMKKRTINLDAFQIIRVIGKGTWLLPLRGARA